MEITVKPTEAPDPTEDTSGVTVQEDGSVTVADQGNTPAENAQAGEQPRKYAGKYNSVEELEKAYLEAQKKISQGGSKPTSEATEKLDGKIPTGDQKPSNDKPAEGSKKSLDDALQEYADKGEVSDETFTELEKLGLTRRQVERYIQAEAALADRFVDQLAEQVGGKETLRDMLTWAREGLSAEEIEAYNKAVQEGNAAVARMMLIGMKARYDASQGAEPSLVSSETVPPSGVTPFTHPDQIVEAMSDPRYEVDPEYTRKVDARLAVSEII